MLLFPKVRHIPVKIQIIHRMIRSSSNEELILKSTALFTNILEAMLLRKRFSKGLVLFSMIFLSFEFFLKSHGRSTSRLFFFSKIKKSNVSPKQLNRNDDEGDFDLSHPGAKLSVVCLVYK